MMRHAASIIIQIWILSRLSLNAVTPIILVSNAMKRKPAIFHKNGKKKSGQQKLFFVGHVKRNSAFFNTLAVVMNARLAEKCLIRDVKTIIICISTNSSGMI